MSDAGYTLAETLAALAVLSLAVGGLTAAAQGLAQRQRLVADTLLDAEGPRAAQAALERLLETAGPFRSHEPDRFRGAARRLQFDCGAPEPCAAELVDATGGQALRLTSPGQVRTLALRRAGLRFRYRGSEGPADAWPPAAARRQALRSVALVAGDAPGGLALAEARVWAEQPLACQFDVILQDCR